MRNKRVKLIVSSLLTLLPLAVGLLLWDKLPELLTTHWGISGKADGWAGRDMATFVLPVSMLLVHWLCLFFTARDPKNAARGGVGNDIVFWIIPAVSNYAAAVIFTTAFGFELDQGRMMLMVFALMFIVIGNKMPKFPQNYSLGIKVPWALNNVENWNATHRFGGKVWVVGGLLLLLAIFLPEKALPWILIGFILPIALIPTLYSYLYYKKQLVAGTATRDDAAFIPKGLSKKGTYISFTLLALLLVGVAALMFTGDISLLYGEDSFTIKASYWSDLTVDYDAIDSVEYIEESEGAMRVNGFGSPRLAMGMFSNSLGNHTRYCYNGCDSAVLLSVDGKYLMINGPDQASTRAIYEELLGKY